ncbi:MAG: aspartate/glutamate racemase family protein [Synergistaceae bacterium]|jgi:allantoin racemase|nr:aspartate/glutamate racemase family protein [Synergistaceae bacterium]
MRLLIVNPFGVDTYDEPIAKTVKRVARPGTEIVVRHMKRGLSFIRHAYFQMLLLPDVVETIYQAEREGFDGATVACAFDPGIKEAKEIVRIPVVGEAASAISIARMLGQKFAIITDAKRAISGITDLVRMNSMETGMVDLVAIDMKVEDMERQKADIRARICDIARELVDKGADSIVIGCSVLSAYTFGMDIPEDLKGIPFIDCNVAAVKTLEMMVDLWNMCGIEPSRRVNFQMPQMSGPADFAYARKVYGITD